MSVDFSLPPYRTGSSDLTVSVSPLGLVELSDEEHTGLRYMVHV